MKTKTKILSILMSIVVLLSVFAFDSFFVAMAEEHSVIIYKTVNGHGTTTDIGGSVSGEGDYKAGDKVTLTATMNDGYCRVGWYGSGITLGGNETTVEFTMPDQSVQVTATFFEHTYIICDLENGTHASKCIFCEKLNSTPEKHYDGNDDDELCDGGCGFDFHNHTFSSWEFDEEFHWYECKSCGDEYADYDEHSFSKYYKSDSHFHWRECKCGERIDEKAHNSPCNVCGYGVEDDKNDFWFMISFDTDGGKFDNGYNVISTTRGDLDLAIEYCNDNFIPKKDGFSFLGWEKVNDVSGVVTLKANWKEA